MMQRINPIGCYDPTPNAYSHAVKVGNVLHISGQGGENVYGELSSDFAKQTEQAIQNLITILNTQNASLEHIAMLRVLVKDHCAEKHAILIEIFKHHWQAFPACTLIPVPTLALEGMQIEIEATAYLP